MRAHEILTEAAKVGREYQHLEDLVFAEGSAGALRAATILQRLGQDSNDVAIKWDGNPTIYWGREPDGTFVLTGKNGWGKNKSTSSDDLKSFVMSTGKGEDWRTEFANNMGDVFSLMERNTPDDLRGYVYGDLLYSPSKPFAEKDGAYHFEPNSVMYSVVSSSDLGRRIGASQIGIAAHSYYDDFGSKSGTSIKDTNRLNTNDVVVLGQTYVPHQAKVDTSQVQEIMANAKSSAQLIDGWLTPEQGLSNKGGIIYTYVNQMVKQGKLNQLQTGFYDWLKTSKVSQGQQAKLMAGDDKGLSAILGLVVQIMTIKNNLIDQLDSAQADVTANTKGQPGGEGYVVGRDKIKLVPRHRWTPNL
tara:strand:- start:4430 stop:5506 length:1077 start_codon:yes stop_codon:yes gene_type:complete